MKQRHGHLVLVSTLVGFGLGGMGCGGAVSGDGSVQRESVQALGSYNVKLDQSSISGVSSGAIMAAQFGVAYSSILLGVGVITGPPFGCSQSDVNTALTTCMMGSPSISGLVAHTNSLASNGRIDATANMAKQKIWIFHGYNDGVVRKSVLDSTYNYYKAFTDEGNIYYAEDNTNAAHAMVTNSYGQTCNVTGGHFVNNCGYDTAGKLLQHIYGTLNAPNTGTLSGSIVNFDVTPFYGGSLSGISMDSSGFAYVPASCAAQQPCRVHIALHGCLQNARILGNAFYAHAGYNQWADTNNMIIVYPQTISTTLNPNGCWDWWGYSSSDYDNQRGPQIAVLRAMLTRLSAGYTGWSPAVAGAFSTPTGITVQDSSDHHVALSWNDVAGASGYNVFRAACAGCAFSQINTAPVKSPSYSDHGLAPTTTYYYNVAAVDAANTASVNSSVVSTATKSIPPFCDPYYRTVFQHWSEGRTFMKLFDAIDTWANGSGQWVGFTGPTSLTTNVLLMQSGASSNYYTVGPPCR